MKPIKEVATMIKFRAWDNECKVIRYYDELKGLTLDALDASDFKLEQFTGLKDVNGKGIYEGDVLRTKAGLIQIVEQGILSIARDDLISGFYANNLSDDKPHTFSYNDEVIGNVHENPELLEADK
ncbi:YopX family protein [Lactiplantibacillus plantarum]|uniref:YopX family protein n=2 Tax=Lactiplantibacillus plantarum TaxID=1590 RepID=UPI003965C53F